MSWQKKSKNLSDFSHKYAVSDKGCWEWQYHLNRGGYGTQVFGSRLDRSRRMMLAHRLFYVLSNGEIPDGLYVLHKCDNRRCVNPDHLFLGTQKDNMQDCVTKGRHKAMKREDNPRSKLKEDDIVDIRRLLAKGIKQKTLAEKFGVNQTLISAIKLERIWK